MRPTFLRVRVSVTARGNTNWRAPVQIGAMEEPMKQARNSSLSRMRAVVSIAAAFTATGCHSVQDPIESRTVGDHVRTDARFSELSMVLGDATLLDADESGATARRMTMLDSLDEENQITLFAPTNAAIRQLVREFGIGLLFDSERLRELLRYHIHEGRMTVVDLKQRTAITTKADPDIHVRYGVDGVLLNDGAKIVAETIIAENGVIHVIDAVLRRPLITETKEYVSAPGLLLTDADDFGAPGFASDTLTVPDNGELHDLRITLEIEHRRVIDLFVFALHQETGTFLPLVRGAQTFQADIRTTLADSADFDVIDDVDFVFDPDSQAFPEDAYRPDEPVELIVGEPLAGTWELIVVDVRPGEVGVLHSWSMTATFGEDAPETAIAFARQRSSLGTLAAGFNEQATFGIGRVAGLTGSIAVSATAGEIGANPVELVDPSVATADLIFPIATDATPGPREIVVVAQGGGASRIATFEATVVVPERSGVELLAHIPLADFGAADGNDVWGWTDGSTGREYALMGTSANTTFVDITNPTEPVILGMLPTQTEASLWRDIKVYADHAFVVSEAADHGLQVFDLTQLRGLTEPQTFVPTAHSTDFGNAHNIVIDEESAVAYVVGATDPAYPNTCAGGLMMFDIAVPTAPQFVGCFAGGVPPGQTPGPEFPTDAYVHDAQCVVYRGPDLDHVGRQICVSSDGQIANPNNYVGIADVTDKSNPIQLARVTYADAGYAHQGWLTEDHQYFILNDEFDEFLSRGNTRTYIWDVRDLDAPVVIGVFDNPRDAVGHNTYIRGNIAYQANYTSGLRIVDIGDIANGAGTEVAFFDTYPNDDDNDGFDDARSGAQSRCASSAPTPFDLPSARRGPVLPHPDNGESSCGVAAFQGAWSNYPFFESGVIPVSDIDRGLFLLRVTP